MKRKYTPKIAPETAGKINVSGNFEEIDKLAKETKCSFCIDFAHILAKEKDYKFNEILKKFKDYKDIYIHFSGIEYGKKGEKNHKKLIKNLPKNKNIIIINESPFPIEDSALGLKIYKNLE